MAAGEGPSSTKRQRVDNSIDGGRGTSCCQQQPDHPSTSGMLRLF